MSKLPKWMRTHIQRCCVAFALDDPGQRLYVRRRATIADAPEASGYTTTSTRYQRGTVTLRTDVPRADASEVLTHELLHVAMMRNGQAVDCIVALLPKKQQAHALEIWHDANEQTVTRLARGLTPLIAAAARTQGD